MRRKIAAVTHAHLTTAALGSVYRLHRKESRRVDARAADGMAIHCLHTTAAMVSTRLGWRMHRLLAAENAGLTDMS